MSVKRGTKNSAGLSADAARANDFVRFMQLVRIPDAHSGCWQWIGNSGRKGYGHFTVRSKAVKAHRWIYECVVGSIGAGLVLRHKCDNPNCVNPNHLEPGTLAENMADMVSRGRNPDRQGEKHPLCKMTDEKVRELRRKWSIGVTRSELSRQYGIAEGQVYKITKRINWRHVQ